MPRYRDFAPTNRLPATWTDAIEELVGNYLDPNFRLERPTATTLQVPAGAGDLEISVAIDGKPRYNTANAVANHPGGIAGSYPIHITANADSFATGVDGYEVNNTVTTFGLKIGAPSGVGAEAISRQVGTLAWDGAAITSVQLDRNSFDAYARFIWGGDTNLYRANTSDLRTDGNFRTVSGEITARIGSAPQVNIGQAGGVGIPMITFGSAVDTNLYRLQADYLKTDDNFAVGTAITTPGIYQTGVVAFAVGSVRTVAALATANASLSAVTGDGWQRFSRSIQGLMEWGTGATSPDTNLYRRGPNQLGSDGGFVITRSAVNLPTFATLIPADVGHRFEMFASGSHTWGPGNTGTDTNLYRSGVSALKTDSNLFVAKALVVGEDNAATSKLFFGSANDTNLYRSAADTLRTDDKFVVGPNAPVSDALLSAAGNGNGLEFGHSNSGGYRGVLGAQSSNGANFLALHAEAGTGGNTYRSRGIRPAIIRADLGGGFEFGNIPLAVGDSQVFTQLLSLDNAGTIRQPAGVLYVSPSGIRTLNSLGNLHLDARRDDAAAATGGIYLNWNFPGSVVFGNGAAVAVATMTTAGNLSLVGLTATSAITGSNVIAASGFSSNVGLIAGTVNNSGYVSWVTPNGARSGYMGFNANGTGINLQEEVGNFTVSGLPPAAGVEKLRIIRGYITSAGSILRGSGFTVVRNGTGNYTVTFTTAFADVPTTVAVGAPGSAQATFVILNGSGTTTVQSFLVFDAAGGVSDRDFSFIAVGPR